MTENQERARTEIIFDLSEISLEINLQTCETWVYNYKLSVLEICRAQFIN